MAFDQDLAERIREQLTHTRGIEEKKMFGGIGFLLNGNMLVGIWKEELIVRLRPEDGDTALREQHVRAFDVTGRPMRGWIMVAPEGLEEDHQLADWISQALAFVEGLPAK
jgi:TfoX/Sxy family transcriptional regulator of competence genes